MTASPSALEQDTSSNSNECLEIGRFLIRKTNHSFRDLIAATRPTFPGFCLPKRFNRPATSFSYATPELLAPLAPLQTVSTASTVPCV
eukprot:2767333-Prymnesium_polylepis.1